MRFRLPGMNSRRVLVGAEHQLLVPLFSPSQRFLYSLGALIWCAVLLAFWMWWLQPAHNIGTVRFTFNSILLGWLTFLPLYFLIIFLRARVTTGEVRLPSGSRVAMVVTKAPSEPWAVVQATLEAMLAQDYPHDTWLADEDPTAEARAWCSAHGVQISTRKGIADYHRSAWPRRTRCKEGNLAYFYDHYGYRFYDFVIQMDADHVPAGGYLREMLKPFADPRVGYVSAPSICDSNAQGSWSARGRLNMESTLHGLLQAGYTAGWAPLCIGSHYGVRTQALWEIGGLGPELAEDHSTTMMFNAHGWRGVHAFNAIANGQGPATFADLVTQEFQWSRSLVTILLCYTPRYFCRLPPRLKFQFVFCQLWYPLFGLFMLGLYAMPIIALASGQPFADIIFVEFLLYVLLLDILICLMAWHWRRNNWFRPYTAKIISWEGVLFLVARWPWVVAGSALAIRDWWMRSFVDFRVTPKGTTAGNALPLRVIAPYAALSLVSALAAFAASSAGQAAGYYVFALLNATIYAVLMAVILVKHAVENGVDHQIRTKPFAIGAPALAGLVVLIAITIQKRIPDAVEAFAHGSERYQLSVVTFAASGAGQQGYRVRTIAWNVHPTQVLERDWAMGIRVGK